MRSFLDLFRTRFPSKDNGGNPNDTSDKLVFDNPVFFKMVKSYLDLGRSARIPVKGDSMIPLIMDKDHITLSPLGSRQLSVFDIVLYEPLPDVHLISRIVDFTDEGHMVLMSDALPSRDVVETSTVRAVVTRVETAGHREYLLDTPEQKTWASDWYGKRNGLQKLLRKTRQEDIVKLFPFCGMPGKDNPRKEYDPSTMYYISGAYFEYKNGENLTIVRDGEIVDLSRMCNFNNTAHYLWEKLNNQWFNAKIMAELLVQEYEIPYSLAFSDSEALLRSWLEMGLIDNE